MVTLQEVMPPDPTAFPRLKAASSGFRSGALSAAEYSSAIVDLVGPVGAGRLLPHLAMAVPVADKRADLIAYVQAASARGEYAPTPEATPGEEEEPTGARVQGVEDDLLGGAAVTRPAAGTDALHVERLRSYYAKHRPDNVAMVDALYSKLGKQIWHSLESKYPGTTAEFTEVGVQGSVMVAGWDPVCGVFVVVCFCARAFVRL
jgi:hypothetical protein